MRFPFVFPQEGEEEGKEQGGGVSKINIFASAVQPQEKYEHVGEEIKMMDLLADVCVCSCVCAHFFGMGGGARGAATIPLLFPSPLVFKSGTLPLKHTCRKGSTECNSSILLLQETVTQTAALHS